MSDFVSWRALANVVLVGLIIGAGLPALFAIGVRALAGPGSRDQSGRRPRVRIVVAVACFGTVVVAVAVAVALIVSGGH